MNDIASQNLADTAAQGWIDVHHHIAPPRYLADGGAGVGRPLKSWSLAKSLEDMDKAGVVTAIVSITQLSKHIANDGQRRDLARDCNDYAAKMVADHRGRFGVYTCYHDKWLGDPAFDPVFAELNRRKAVIYVHPSIPDCCLNLVPGIGDTAIEYGTDTTRAIARMVFGGASQRFPDLRLIWSHAGGTMPFLIECFIRLAQSHDHAARLPQGFLPEARRFFYDTAQVANHTALTCAREVIPDSHFVFGSDFPYRTAAEHVEGLARAQVFDAAQLGAIAHGNLAMLLPKYARAKA